MLKDISGYTNLYGVIGKPVKHSLSPKMYNYCFEAMGINSVYLAFEADENTTPQVMGAVRALGICGINVTMPCKKAVIPFLDEISPQAEIMNAVNTITQSNGRLVGHNTDGIGMVRAITNHTGGKIPGNRIVIFGSGGAAKAILVALAVEQADEICVFRRRSSKSQGIENIIKALEKSGTNTSLSVGFYDDKAFFAKKISEASIIINATSLGMEPNQTTTPLEDASLLSAGQLIVDAVYKPLETRLIREAKAAGCDTIFGTEMLLQQGAENFRLFTGKEMPVDEVRKHLFPEDENL